MAAIVVIGGARPFGGDHGGAQRRLGRTLLTEGWTFIRLLQAFEYLPADADLGLARADVLHLENPIGIEIAERVAEFIAALGNDADPAPASVCDIENLRDHFSGGNVALARDRAGVRVFHFRA